MALCYPVLSFIGFKIPKKPVFTAINKAVSTGGFLITNDFILFDRNSTCWALSRKCTHLGCKLNYHEELDLLECPCHQSQFHASTGQVIKGPAKKPLSFFPVEKKQGEPRYVVTT
ncbi:MAG: Rieske (2Fe-2S) protein [Desulfobulbaceae bacterium]|nr:Rieske (2Fe-2S) protein [Desulfobulbaceae bacterium]